MYYRCMFGFIGDSSSHPKIFHSIMWRRHHCLSSVTNFDLCSTIMAIEIWGFFSVPHLLWHGATLYNGHHRGMTRIRDPNPYCQAFECGAAVTNCFYDLGLSRLGFELPTSACEANALTACATDAAFIVVSRALKIRFFNYQYIFQCFITKL